MTIDLIDPTPIPLTSIRSSNRRRSSSPLNDKSIPWDASLPRPWWDYDRNSVITHEGLTSTSTSSTSTPPLPPALITITSIGWNHPNQTEGLTHFRTARSRELLLGIINHPWFHPTAWDDMMTATTTNNNSNNNNKAWFPPNNTRIYVFMDTEVCGEKSYPIYGAGLRNNADTVMNRTDDWRRFHPQNPLRYLMTTPIMKITTHDIKLIVFDCGGNGPRYSCLHRSNNKSPRIALASISSSPWHHFPVDQAFPPPVVKEIPLNQTHLHHIQFCHENTRPFLMTFAGNFRSQTRKNLRDFVHNGKDIIMASGKIMQKRNVDYETLLRQSKFGAAPRGDNLFSYRFSEIMSSGAIPVIYADDWVLPFEQIINWTQISVTIPEKHLNQTHSILSRIGDRQRCRMRQNMLRVYQKYVRWANGTIAGIIEGLEAKAKAIQHMSPDELKEYRIHETQLLRDAPSEENIGEQ